VKAQVLLDGLKLFEMVLDLGGTGGNMRDINMEPRINTSKGKEWRLIGRGVDSVVVAEFGHGKECRPVILLVVDKAT
jgi:hypothetical protein